ncbi:hypothetical protein BJY04DRAFT_181955 [Aspergillus karnatakaensis]|uniref:uncharacterized protein n=1 Tax=Aspergillus karnatakaensis TaxID=1810916 RepID=UPI003CCDCDD2
MLGHSRSGSRQNLLKRSVVPATGSPGRRRVTRSQSREVEDTRGNSIAVNASARHDDNLSKRGQSKALTPVVEETPIRTPRKTGNRYGASYVPESPDTTNISGTTMFDAYPEPESEPGSESGPDSEMLLDALPDLEREGKRILGFLTPSTATPKEIKKNVKLLSDRGSTQSRRFTRSTANFAEQFGTFANGTYIDAGRITHMISSALAPRHADFRGWSPSPIVHMANCARFAQEILFTGAQANLQRQAIRHIESLFPLPFTSGLVVAGQERAPGQTALENETLELALNIRTQSLIQHLEDHQDEPDFNPGTAVRRYFLNEASDQSSLRGFNLPEFGHSDGTLPEQYGGTVQRHLDNILLYEDDDDGSIDVTILKGVFHWDLFSMSAAAWIQRRTREIQSELENFMSVHAVQDAFFDSKQPTIASPLGGSAPEPNAGITDPEQSVPQRETTRQEVTPHDEVPRDNAEQDNTGRLNVEQETLAAPEVRQHQPESTVVRQEKDRRRSSLRFLNSSSMQSLKKRQERLQSGREVANKGADLDVTREVPKMPADQTAINHEQNSSTLPAIPPEVPQSPEATPTLAHDEPDITLGEETHLTIGNDGSHIERSHSPPLPRTAVPWSQGGQRAVDTDEMAIGRSVWELTKSGASTQSSVEPTQAGPSGLRFIDRQANAERVSPNMYTESPGAVTRVEERVSRKRARPLDEVESDVDRDYFDYDNHPVDIERQRARKPQRPIDKRPRVEVPGVRDHTSVDANEDEYVDEPLRAAHRRRQPGVISPRPSSQRTVYNARRNWTEAEDRRLYRLMEENGVSWRKIEQKNESDPVLQGETRIIGRDQVALKDRARNIKIKRYREGLPVPQFFDNVTMKAKDYAHLEKQGIIVPRP